MAQDVANDLTYYLLVAAVHKNDLINIRQWSNLCVAFEGDQIWVKDFNETQIQSLEVKTIPYKTIFYSQKGQLFQINSRLPDRTLPSLLWSPIDRALTIKLPAFNHNYFGLKEKISIQLVPSEAEEQAIAMITSIAQLGNYIETAAAIRLQPLTWAILNKEQVILFGKPLLPLSGESFWHRNDFIIPSGFDFDLPILCDFLNHSLNPEHNAWVIWNTDQTCFLVQKTDMQPLSISSFRRSIHQLSTSHL